MRYAWIYQGLKSISRNNRATNKKNSLYESFDGKHFFKRPGYNLLQCNAWIYLVLKSISPNKRASRQKTSIIHEVTPGVCVQKMVWVVFPNFIATGVPFPFIFLLKLQILLTEFGWLWNFFLRKKDPKSCNVARGYHIVSTQSDLNFTIGNFNTRLKATIAKPFLFAACHISLFISTPTYFEDNATGDIQLLCKLFSGERSSYNYSTEKPDNPSEHTIQHSGIHTTA